MGSVLATLWPKRLPDRSEPWASGIRQANLFHLLSKLCATDSFIVSNLDHKVSVCDKLIDTANIVSFPFAERMTAD